MKITLASIGIFMMMIFGSSNDFVNSSTTGIETIRKEGKNDDEFVVMKFIPGFLEKYEAGTHYGGLLLFLINLLYSIMRFYDC